MRYRHAYIEDNKVLADSGTEVIDIRVTSPITELLIQLYALNYSSGNKQSPIARCVSKIEIVDGSDVLFSLSGQQAIALAFYDSGKMPARKIGELWNWSQVDHFPIRFGRFLGDPLLAFDPTKFTNPQLKITWDLATVNIIDSTGFTSDSGRLTVIAKIMEDPTAAPVGFLMNKEHYAFTTAASGDENIDLPTDYPYRKLLVRSYEAGVELAAAITELKLSVDQDRFVPFDLHAVDLARMMENWFGKAWQEITFLANHDDTREVWIDMEVGGWAIGQGNIPRFCMVTDSYASRATLGLYDAAGGTLSDCEGTLYITGRCVESCFCYPFGRQDVIEEAFAAPDFASIRLMLTQNNINGAASVILQQIRSY